MATPRFGHDFSKVRIHADPVAAESARAVNAYAYTVGHDIVFGPGSYAPHSTAGQKLLLHELTHVVQQQHVPASGPGPVVVDSASGQHEDEAKAAEGGAAPHISSLPAARVQRQIGAEQEKICGGTWTCAATPCETPDTAPTSAAATSWKLLVRIDVEAPTPEDVGAKTVGHTYVEFVESNGARYTYGFYPSPSGPTPDPMFHPDVFGCIVHPDTNHQSCVDYTVTFDLGQKEYADALQFAQTWCKAPPHYQLQTWNCTTFAVEVAKKAGKSLPSPRGKVGGTIGVTADNPNTLLEGLIPTLTLRSDTNIRKWVSGQTPASIDALPVEEKIRMINRLLDGWVSDDDLDAVDKICTSVTSAGQMKQIRDKISPRVSELSGGASGDRARLRAALSHNP